MKNNIVLLPPRLFASVAYYAIMAAYPKAAIYTDARYRKNDKLTHRFEIADTRGKLMLTVPIVHPSGIEKWNEVMVSSHGRWNETIPIALESAYGRTPFFEFYVDRLMPLFEIKEESIINLCLRADDIVRKILKLKTQVVDYNINENYDIFINNKIDNIFVKINPYWQIRIDQLGFISNLSILDLIFNLGPEAELYLEKMSLDFINNVC